MVVRKMNSYNGHNEEKLITEEMKKEKERVLEG